MASLLLRLAAPLQSWGSESKFETRRTQAYPTKSGVIGMLAAALGRPRDSDLADLSKLKFGIRIDRQGQTIYDYHIARQKKGKNKTDTHVSKRYYLSDAVFLAVLEGDDEFINEIAAALKNPVFPLFLGRRSCPPTVPLLLETNDKPLLENLCTYEMPHGLQNYSSEPMRIITDSEASDMAAQSKDVPVSFNPFYRKFTWRNVYEFSTDKFSSSFVHDPMEELR